MCALQSSTRKVLQTMWTSRSFQVAFGFHGCLTRTWLMKTVHFSTSVGVASGKDLPLTSVRYPYVKRGSFSEVTSEDVAKFREILPEASRVLTNPDEVDVYNRDWMGQYRGSSQVVLRPKTTDEVSAILKYCNDRRLAVVPQGGNTGLVGGSIPVFDEVIVSTQLMNNIMSLDKTTGVLVCQAGCVLEQLNEHLEKSGFMMPLDLGSKGSCNIGGNVSTNAGGIRLLRYGSLHGSVLGIEAVMANGEVIDSLSTLRKDNVGYHLKHLFIGSEGTLGLVTAVSILCPSRPKAISIAFLACESFDKVLQTLSFARAELNEILSAFELLDSESLFLSTRHLKVTNPLETSAPFYVLVETSGSNSAHDEAKLNSFLKMIMDAGIVIDGTVTTDPSKMGRIWSIRESVAAGLLDEGHCYKYDISLPLSRYYEFVDVMRKKLDGVATRVCGYGHVGDGNLHFNATSREYSKEVLSIIEPFLYEYVAKFRGSISAEHGLGFAKRKHIHFGRSEPAVGLMKQMKALLDPHGILNPYKTLP